MVRISKRHVKESGIFRSFIPTKDPTDKFQLSVIDYNEKAFLEKENVSVEECLKLIETPTMTWIHVLGSDSAKITEIANHFKIHPLAIEDILNARQRPKLDTYEDQVFITLRLLSFDIVKQELSDEQISLVFGANYLISFSEKDETIFNTIKQKLRQSNQRIRQYGSDYLAYSIIDLIVDKYFIVLEQLDLKLEKLEEDLLRQPKPAIVEKIQEAKIDMIFLRKSVWPMRDVVSRFQHLEQPLVSTTTQIYLRDVHDHLVQIIDIIEGFRDIVAGMLDIYLSNINIRTNDIMKVLTIVSTIFVPLTFIASIYGMNFEYMPELHKPWGYPMVLTFMLIMSCGMLIYFRRKKWI